MVMKRTKIVSTLGPASNSLATLRKMVAAGVDIVRLNFSHGTADEKRALVEVVRQAAREEGKIIGILADLQGPKIRVARFQQGSIELVEGAQFVLDADLAKDAGDEHAVGIDYKELPRDVSPADILLLDDGRVVLEVEQVVGNRIICRVQVGGTLSNNKGINRQFGGLSAGALTDKDRADLKVAVGLGVDYIAISFVRSEADVHETRELIAQEHGQAGIIAKIERIEAVVPETLRAIIQASDGVMVARGDLAVEIGDAEIPAAQKLIIECSRELHKPVITATQMMETMITNVVPTRAEVSDVANAVLDGTDAVMLSAESATGKHPTLVVQTMARICLAAEKHPRSIELRAVNEVQHRQIAATVATASMQAARDLGVSAIISLTETGSTPLWVSRTRSGVPVFGLSRNKIALGKMALYSNVYPVEFDVTAFANNDLLIRAAIEHLKQLGHLKAGDLVVVTAGGNDAIGVPGRTNSMTILQVN